MNELLVMAFLVMVMNVFDSVTTAVCFRQYPDPTYEGEANPLMRWLMRCNKWLAEFVKQGFVLGIVWLLYQAGDLKTLRLAFIVLGLVVLNNLYVAMSGKIAKRKLPSLASFLAKVLRIPKPLVFVIVAIGAVSLSYLIYSLIW